MRFLCTPMFDKTSRASRIASRTPPAAWLSNRSSKDS